MKLPSTLKILQYIILCGAVALAIYQVAPHVKDFYQLVKLKDKIHYGYVFAALLAQTFQYVGDAWLSQILLKMVKIKMNIKDTIRIAALNVFAAHILPVGEAGGLAAAYHFYKKLGVDSEKFIFLSLSWGIITNGMLLLLFFLPLFFLSEVHIPINKSLIYILLIIGASIATIYVTRKILFIKLEKALGKYNWSTHLFSFIRKRDVYKDMFFTHPKLVIQALLACLIYYASNIATLIFAFLAFDTFPSLAIIIFAYAASLVFGRITLAPAGIGAAEATLILIFVEYQIDPTITVGAVLIYRLMSFWLPLPAGFASFYSLRKDTNQEVLFQKDI